MNDFWEYREIEVRRDNMSLVMNKQGEDGWELVSAFPDPSCKMKQKPSQRYQLIFKRSKKSDPFSIDTKAKGSG